MKEKAVTEIEAMRAEVKALRDEVARLRGELAMRQIPTVVTIPAPYPVPYPVPTIRPQPTWSPPMYVTCGQTFRAEHNTAKAAHLSLSAVS